MQRRPISVEQTVESKLEVYEVFAVKMSCNKTGLESTSIGTWQLVKLKLQISEKVMCCCHFLLKILP